jgi:hypothetical protein
LEEGDRARQEKATSPQAYPYELWGGSGSGAGVCWWVCILLLGGGRKNVAGIAELKRRVKVLEEFVRGEAVDQRERPEVSHTDLKRLHERLTNHEQIFRAAMSRLEAAVEMPL